MIYSLLYWSVLSVFISTSFHDERKQERERTNEEKMSVAEKVSHTSNELKEPKSKNRKEKKKEQEEEE
jgi:hypothetical protein